MKVIQDLLSDLFELFTTPIFSIGGTAISVVLLLKLTAAFAIVIFLVQVVKSFLKKRLLTRFKVDASNREAIATIISYFLGAISLLVIIHSIGFNIASLGLILGGVGVGIGFGLQNISNDFISGLTLLFERTLKVGDFVEFDGLAGHIKEVKLRSTVIRTLDNGDVVVPNSQLVENRVLNWSYDSFTARLRIPVAVAYDSDPVLVTETLLKSAYMEASVLREPLPRVNLIGFGDNALQFEVRVWVSQIDQREDIISSLNFIIEYNLRQQGIKIPFPQRDVWLRNIQDIPPVANFSARPSNHHGGLNDFAPAPMASATTPASVHSYLQAEYRESAGAFTSHYTLRDLLRRVAYFEKFTDLEIRQLIEIGYRKRINPSDLIFREDDPGNAFYVILSGSVEIFVEKLQKRLTVLQPGQFFGEVSLLLGIPRTATARALDNVLLFVINSRGFSKLLQDYPDLAELIVEEFSRHQDELVQRQQELRQLGLLEDSEDDNNPVNWARKRLKRLFNL